MDGRQPTLVAGLIQRWRCRNSTFNFGPCYYQTWWLEGESHHCTFTLPNNLNLSKRFLFSTFIMKCWDLISFSTQHGNTVYYNYDKRYCSVSINVDILRQLINDLLV